MDELNGTTESSQIGRGPRAYVYAIALGVGLALVATVIAFLMMRSAARAAVEPEMRVVRSIDEMGDQTVDDLNMRVVTALRKAVAARSNQSMQTAVTGLENAWHPGIAATSQLKRVNEYPGVKLNFPACENVPYVLQDYFPNERSTQPADLCEQNDKFAVSAWVPARVSEIAASSNAESFVSKPPGYDGPSYYRSGAPLFYKAYLYRKRGELSAPIALLYAVDDGGSWWLAGISSHVE